MLPACQASKPPLSRADCPDTPLSLQQLSTRADINTLLISDSSLVKSASNAKCWLKTKGWAQPGELYNHLKLVYVLMTAATVTKGSHLENNAKNAVLAVAFLMESDINDQKVEVIANMVATKVLDWVNSVVNHLAASNKFTSATSTAQAETMLALKDIL
ncbi:hypothetical protein H2248_006197, partial [Termitomyces sp. 'cryptogamus']